MGRNLVLPLVFLWFILSIMISICLWLLTPNGLRRVFRSIALLDDLVKLHEGSVKAIPTWQDIYAAVEAGNGEKYRDHHPQCPKALDHQLRVLHYSWTFGC